MQRVRDPVARVLQLQRLGTRAVVAEVFVQKAEKVARTVEHLLDAGAAGDLAAAKALVPWIDQAYGKPTERVEHTYPTSIEELKDMGDEQLVRLVAEGRRKRLQRQGLDVVPDASDWRRRDPTRGKIALRPRHQSHRWSSGDPCRAEGLGRRPAAPPA